MFFRARKALPGNPLHPAQMMWSLCGKMRDLGCGIPPLASVRRTHFRRRDVDRRMHRLPSDRFLIAEAFGDLFNLRFPVDRIAFRPVLPVPLTGDFAREVTVAKAK